VLGDQLSVQTPGQQRPSIRVGPHEVGIRPSPVQGDLAEVADTRRQLQPDQIEESKVNKGRAVGIGRVLSDRLVSGVAENFVQHIVRLSVGGHDDFRAERRMLVVYVGVGAEPLPRRRSSAIGRAPSATCPWWESVDRPSSKECPRRRPG